MAAAAITPRSFETALSPFSLPGESFIRRSSRDESSGMITTHYSKPKGPAALCQRSHDGSGGGQDADIFTVGVVATSVHPGPASGVVSRSAPSRRNAVSTGGGEFNPASHRKAIGIWDE